MIGADSWSQRQMVATRHYRVCRAVPLSCGNELTLTSQLYRRRRLRDWTSTCTYKANKANETRAWSESSASMCQQCCNHHHHHHHHHRQRLRVTARGLKRSQEKDVTTVSRSRRARPSSSNGEDACSPTALLREVEEEIASKGSMRTDIKSWMNTSTALRALITSSPFIGLSSAVGVVFFKHLVIEMRESLRDSFAFAEQIVTTIPIDSESFDISESGLFSVALGGPILVGIATSILKGRRFGPGLARMELSLDGVIDESSIVYRKAFSDNKAALGLLDNSDGDDDVARLNPEKSDGFTQQQQQQSIIANKRTKETRRVPADESEIDDTFSSLRRLLASAFSLSGGVSLGPEAPSAEIGGALGLLAGRSVETLEEKRMLLASGAAAGVAAAFHAPFAGALYAVELVLKRRGLNRVSLSSVFVSATVSATVVTQLEGILSEGNVGFPLDAIYIAPLNSVDFLLCGGLGVLCALASSTLYEIIRVIQFRVSISAMPQWITLCSGGLLIGGLATYFPIVGYGNIPLDSILTGSFTSQIGTASTAASVGVKILATGLSKGVGYAGGIFAPTLAIGGLIGSGYWLLLHSMSDSIDVFYRNDLLSALLDQTADFMPVTYTDHESSAAQFALMGAGALMASACKVPLTATAMLFELSRNPSLLCPLMVTTGVAVIVTERLELLLDDSIQLNRDNDRSCSLNTLVTTNTAMKRNSKLKFRETIDSNIAKVIMRQEEVSEGLIVDFEGEVIGVIRLDEKK